MYPYTKQLTLDEALKLSEVNETALAYHLNYRDIYGENPDKLNNWDIPSIYNQGDYLSCDALTYATYILNQATPPEGWGYAALSVDNNKRDIFGRYSQLPYLSYSTGKWEHGVQELFTVADDENWYLFCFPLEDLARVEAMSEKEIAEESAKANTWPERPDAIRPAKQEQTFGQFVDKVLDVVDWEAKYNSLLIDEKQLQEERNTWRNKYSELADRFNAQAQESSNLFLDAAERATLQDSLLESQNTIAIQEKRIRDLEHYKSISDDYVKAFENRDAAKDTLKQAEINLIEARSEYYPY
jgi:hypothetical protein